MAQPFLYQLPRAPVFTALTLHQAKFNQAAQQRSHIVVIFEQNVVYLPLGIAALGLEILGDFFHHYLEFFILCRNVGQAAASKEIAQHFFTISIRFYLVLQSFRGQ